MNTSTTTDHSASWLLPEMLSFFADIAKVIGICAALVVSWLMAMIVIMVLFEPTDSALVIVKDPGIIRHLPENVFLTATGDNSITVRSDDSNYVAHLYSIGAIVVLPALNNGCIALR